MMIKTLEYGLNYLSTYWRASGRPLMTLVMNEAMLGIFALNCFAKCTMV